MTDETKQEIEVVLTLLKNTLVSNGVSIALEKKKTMDAFVFLIPQSIVAPGNLKGYLLKQWIW